MTENTLQPDTDELPPLDAKLPYRTAERFAGERYKHRLGYNEEQDWFLPDGGGLRKELYQTEVEAELWFWLDESPNPELQVDFDLIFRALKAYCFKK